MVYSWVFGLIWIFLSSNFSKRNICLHENNCISFRSSIIFFYRKHRHMPQLKTDTRLYILLPRKTNLTLQTVFWNLVQKQMLSPKQGLPHFTWLPKKVMLIWQTFFWRTEPIRTQRLRMDLLQCTCVLRRIGWMLQPYWHPMELSLILKPKLDIHLSMLPAISGPFPWSGSCF